jgi:hypothetical protein
MEKQYQNARITLQTLIDTAKTSTEGMPIEEGYGYIFIECFEAYNAGFIEIAERMLAREDTDVPLERRIESITDIIDTHLTSVIAMMKFHMRVGEMLQQKRDETK